MKSSRGVLSVVVVGLAVGLGWALFAQTRVQSVQEVVASAQELAALEPVAEKTIPVVSLEPWSPPGTYWMLQESNSPPLPFDMFPELPFYSLGNDNYLIDDRSVDYEAMRQALEAQAEGEAAATALVRGGDLGGRMVLMDSSGSLLEGYSSNDLWLEVIAVTNVGTSQTAYLAMHTPETNGVYDLFLTTNLSPDVPGLNLTNWQWVLRNEPGQTNLAVTNLSADQGYFRLGTTNDTDSDGLSDAFEELASHTDPDNGDQNTNGIPDGWEWNYFGSLQPGDSDYDGDDVSNWDEYQNGTDPNTIKFTVRLGNQHFNTVQATGGFVVFGGVPAKAAVLVNSTNFSGAAWASYDGIAAFTLGPADGVYRVTLGLKGRATNSVATWLGTSVTLDRVAPTVEITSPTTTNVSKPMIQIQGYVTERLWSADYDLTNALGLQTNLSAYPREISYGTNWVVTNRFQCYDVELTNGLNTVTVRVTDFAGNVTTNVLNYFLDYAADPNPPVISLNWPQDGARVSGTNFTLRGRVDDETAQVVAQIVSGGQTNTLYGLVERSGALWVEDVPMADGTNVVTLTATDAAANFSVTNIAVVKSEVILTMDDVPEEQLNQPTVTVTGSISDSAHKVWVNGVAATITDGTWTATNVPMNSGGTAVFVATAIPLSDNNGNGTAPSGDPGDPSTQNPTSANATATISDADKGDELVVVTGEWHQQFDQYDLALVDYLYDLNRYFWRWNETKGGYASFYYACCVYSNTWVYHINTKKEICMVDTNGNCEPCSGAGQFWEGWQIDRPMAQGALSWWNPLGLAWPCSYAFMSAEGVQVVFRPGGKARPGFKDLFVASGSATEVILDPFDVFVTGPEVPKQEIYVPGFGKNLGADGKAYAALPAGEPIDVTFQTSRPYYDFDPHVTRHKPYITANDIPLEPDEVVPDAEFCVGQKVTFELKFDPDLSYVDLVGHWKLPDKFVNEPFQYSSTCTSYRINDSLLQNTNQTSCWYVNGSGGLASIGASLRFSNGRHASVAAMGKFSVYRPKIWLEPLTADEQNHYYTVTPYLGGFISKLKLGENDESGDGTMRFSVNINSKYGGEIGLTQLITANYSNPLYIFSVERCDGSEFYDGPWNVGARTDPNAKSGLVSMGDGPFCIWEDPNIVNLSCRDFVRFQPTGGIYVTLGIVTWHTVGVARNLFGVWSIETDATTGPNGPDRSDEFPVWNINQGGMH